jgi:hypothetical protein
MGASATTSTTIGEHERSENDAPHSVAETLADNGWAY